MISFEEAKRIAIAKIGPDCALVDSATLEKPYGWYFLGQSRAYLETGDIGKMLVGSGGFIVERDSGRVFVFGSAYPRERWIANYERGFKYDRYDLNVVAVSDFRMAVGLLQRLGMQYVIPEEENGTTWMVPQNFTQDRIREKLARLPCVFANQAFWHRVDIFDEIDASGCCRYELHEHPADSKSAKVYGEIVDK